jgi:WD40 repeat protein
LLHREGHQHAVQDGVFTPDGKMLATVSDELFVHLWDLSTGKDTHFARDTAAVEFVAISPDGKTLAACGSMNGFLGLWDLSTGYHRRWLAFKGLDTPGHRVVFSPDGKTLFSSMGQANLCLWNVATGQQLPQMFKGTIDPASSSFTHYVLFALAPDGKTVATTRNQSSGSGVVLWDAATGKELRQLAEKGIPAAFSPDGRLLALLDGKDVRLLDVVRGVEVRYVQGDAQRATCAAFSPDGKMLATAGEEGVVYVWETATGKQRLRLPGHRDTIQFLAFAPDGRQLASGGEDLTVLLWDLAEP